MGIVFDILAEIETSGAGLESLTVWQALSWVAFGFGAVVLIFWLIRNKGIDTLESAPVRLNKMRLHTPLIQLFAWVLLISVTGILIKKRFGDPLTIQGQLAQYVGLLAINSAMIGSILVVAFMNFHGRLKGFGINYKTLGKDAGWGFVNYIAAMPVVMICISIVVRFGKLYYGADFEIPKNESLELLGQINIGFKILVIFSAAFVVPVFEELLFRGLIQSTLRTHLNSSWMAIILTSLVFVVMHGIWLHWLPLMALSVCMGYAYEKSGSILRSIFIHVMFNSVSIIGTLLNSG